MMRQSAAPGHGGPSIPFRQPDQLYFALHGTDDPRWRLRPPPPRRQTAARWHVPPAHGLVIGAVIALLWAGISFNLWRDHAQAERQAVADTANLSRAFEENIDRTIEAVDQTVLFVRDAYARDPTGFDLSTWARARPS
jgi:hypothetical protein